MSTLSTLLKTDFFFFLGCTAPPSGPLPPPAAATNGAPPGALTGPGPWLPMSTTPCDTASVPTHTRPATTTRKATSREPALRPVPRPPSSSGSRAWLPACMKSSLPPLSPSSSLPARRRMVASVLVLGCWGVGQSRAVLSCVVGQRVVSLNLERASEVV